MLGHRDGVLDVRGRLAPAVTPRLDRERRVALGHEPRLRQPDLRGRLVPDPVHAVLGLARERTRLTVTNSFNERFWIDAAGSGAAADWNQWGDVHADAARRRGRRC